MKKFISVLLVMLLVLSACAFAEPVIVNDDDVFEDTLDIDIDTDDLALYVPAMAIIDNIGEISFVLPNVDMVDVNWAFRFTRDDALATDLTAFAGITSEDVSDPMEVEYEYIDVDDDGDEPDEVYPYTVTQYNIDGGESFVMFWTVMNVHYCLTVDGTFSQMQFAEVMDKIEESIDFDD